MALSRTASFTPFGNPEQRVDRRFIIIHAGIPHEAGSGIFIGEHLLYTIPKQDSRNLWEEVKRL
jgi:hypothetical protein